MAYYTYILECVDGTYYTGSTDNLYNRVAQHNEGRGATYTSRRLPAKLVHYEEFPDRSSAVRRELEIKKMNKGQKKKLIDSPRSSA
jgi:putative endonuclease